MYTEIAPPDAIGQRGGRLNRKGDKKGCIMHIYNVVNDNPYKDNKHSIMDLTRKYIPTGIMNYEKILNWCNKVYDIKLILNNNLLNRFTKQILFGDQSPFSFRDIKYIKINVVLKEDFDNYKGLYIPRDYYISVPKWRIEQDLKMKKEDETYIPKFESVVKVEDNKEIEYIICNCQYSYEDGLNYDKH